MNFQDQIKHYVLQQLYGLNFNPNQIIIDMTDENYLKSTNKTNTLKGSYSFINGFTFKVDSVTSTRVRFYKIDPTANYANSSSIINITIT